MTMTLEQNNMNMNEPMLAEDPTRFTFISNTPS